MSRVVNFSLALIMLAVFASASFAQEDNMQGAYSFMFVQTAKGVSFKDGKMTLKGVAPSMVFFADRPERMAGHFPVTHFLQMWDEGKDSFKNDPPNANLSILGSEEGATNIVVEISNPVLSEKGDLTYDVKVLDGEPPAEGGLSSLFIDWWVGPRGAVCQRNWYTGGTWCHFPGRYYYGPHPRPYWVY